MKNYSRQREAILQVLKDMKTHPTASAVYERVREILPKISLGTVYRNLSQLRDSGEILSLTVGDGFEHFDGDSHPHIHLHCQNCKRIEDLVMKGDPAADCASRIGFEARTSVYIVYGNCKDCAKKEKQEKII
jgi:Fe2+ or Zn2+ uptake regulation protein